MTRTLIADAFLLALVVASSQSGRAQVPSTEPLKSVTVGILREDAVLVPIARVDAGAWVPWFGDRPADDWELLDGGGARRRIRVTGRTEYENHCTTDIGLATNFTARVDLEPASFPLPYAGIVATERGLLMPITSVSGNAASFRILERQLPALFGRLEPALWEPHEDLYRPSLTGRLPRPVLDRVFASSLSGGRQLFLFNAHRELRTSVTGAPLEDVTRVAGWALGKEGASQLVLIDAKASASDLDGKGGDDTRIPRAALTLGGRTYWIGNTSGYEWETYFVLEVTSGRPGALVSIDAGGC